MTKFKANRILTIGTATRDIIANLDRSTLERVVMRNSKLSFMLLELGSKVEAKSIQLEVGGGAINSAVSFSKLDFNVGTIVKIGKDDNGLRVIERLNKYKIDASKVIYSNHEPTAISLLISSYEKNPGIIIDRGANSTMSTSELDINYLSEFDAIYIANLSNQSVHCGSFIAKAARKKGLITFLNPGIRQITSTFSELLSILNNIDYLSLNSKEATVLFDNLLTRQNFKKVHNRKTSQIKQLIRDPILEKFKELNHPLAKESLGIVDFSKLLHEIGIKYVIITDSINGSFVCDGTNLYHCPVRKVKKMEGSAGAGDAFNSTFFASHIVSNDVSSSMIKASINSASVVTKPDTQSKLLSKKSLDTKYESLKNKLSITKTKI